MRKSAAAVTAVTLATALAAGAQAAVAQPTPLTQSTPSPQDKQGIVKRALAAAGEHRQETRAGAGQDFKATDVLVDRDGTKHTRMDRTYQGLPVLGGDMVVHQGPGGDWRGVSKTLAADPVMSTTPKISAEDAKKAAATKGYTATGTPTPVVEARGASTGAPKLAWQVTETGKQEGNAPSRVKVTVDALTGQVLLREETIQTSIGDGVGKSLYSGDVPLKTNRSYGVYKLQDPTRGNTYTADSYGRMDCPLAPNGAETDCGNVSRSNLFKDGDNWWGYGLLGRRQAAAVDAQYGTNMAWDYYKNTFGRNGIAGDGKGSYNRVHYGQNLANATWNQNDCFCMSYGDGDGRTMRTVVSLDVAGHELSHGVTGTTAKLVYAGESGALNEATSDIFGTAIEFFANNPNNPPNYLIGEKIKLNSPALRFMDKPSKDGHSADFWSKDTAGLEVHSSSGVGNHFFYLLAEGSGAKTINGRSYDSPTANRSAVTGIGIDPAAKIWYRALTTYMTANTNFKGAREATLKSATDLFGVGSAQVKSVAAAWTAVNVA